MGRMSLFLTIAASVLSPTRFYSQEVKLERVLTAIETNARIVHSRWVGSYQVRLQLYQGTDYNKPPFESFPVGTLRPVRTSERWCWHLTAWSDGVAGEQQIPTCISPGEYRWFSLQQVFQAINKNIKLVESTSNISVFEITPRPAQQLSGMLRRSACASSVRAKLTVDRRTSHPIELTGDVEGSGCSSVNSSGGEAAANAAASVVESPRRGSAFKYTWSRKVSSVSDDYSAWILTEAYEGDPFWISTKHSNLVADWIEVVNRKFTLVERDLFGNPLFAIRRRYPQNTMMTVHTTAYDIEEFTAESRVINSFSALF